MLILIQSKEKVLVVAILLSVLLIIMSSESSCSRSDIKHLFPGVMVEEECANPEEFMKKVVETDCSIFPTCKNILTCGMSKDELVHAICCISLVLHNNTAEKYLNGTNLIRSPCVMAQHPVRQRSLGVSSWLI